MKILFISHYSELLGANRSLLGLVEGLLERGISCTVLCRKAGDFTEALAEKSIDFEVIPFQNWADTFLFPGYWLLPLKHLRNIQLRGRLAQFFEKVKPDLIHTNSSVAPVGAYMAEEFGVPHVWHVREFGRLDYNMRFFPSHRNMIHWLKKASRVIAISKAIQKEVIKDHLDHWELIYNGVLTKKQVEKLVDLKQEVKNANEPFRFLMIGMIHPSKNQMEALQAFDELHKQNQNTELHFVGSGRKVYTQQLKNYVVQNALEGSVVFHGFVKNPEPHFLKADAVLMCSRNEGMGRVTAEAMAYAKPLIGYHGGATPELIDSGKNGYLYRDQNEMVQYMQKMVSDRAAAQRMGQNGRVKALAEFTVDAYVEKVLKVYKEALQTES